MGDGYLRALAAGGEEIALLQAAFDLSQPEDAVVLDVGANIGYTAMTMSRLRAGAKILAFEPSPSTFEFLEGNIGRNNRENIEPQQVALSDKAGQLGWTQDASDSSSAHLALLSENVVAVSTVDEVVSQMQRPPTFIKIDVEGSELAVLRGAAQTIKNGNAVLLIELNSFSLIAYGDVSPKAVIDFVLEHYERVFWLDGDKLKELHDGNSILELLHVQFTSGLCVHDLLCVPAGVRLSYDDLKEALDRIDKPSRAMVSTSIIEFEFRAAKSAIANGDLIGSINLPKTNPLRGQGDLGNKMLAAFKRMLK